jgi:hypothetical protein
MPTMDLKVGDKLVIPREFGSTPSLVKVDRLTKTQAVLSDGTRIALDNGKVIGSTGYRVRFARVATDEDILSMRIAKAQTKLRAVVVTADNLEHVLTLLETIKTTEVE